MMSKTRQLIESFQSNLNESEQLNEKINKDNVEVNKILSNPNAGKNREKIKDMGYELDTEYGTNKAYAIRNPKTNKYIDLSNYSKDDKKKVDFKNKLDSDRPTIYKTSRYADDIAEDRIPKSAKIGKDNRNHAVYDSNEIQSYSNNYTDRPKDSISSNINDYKKAIRNKEDAESSVKHSEGSLKYYEDQVQKAQKDLDFQKSYIDRRRKDADDAEAKRKDILHKVRVKRGIAESEKILQEQTYRNIGWDLDIEVDDTGNITNVSTGGNPEKVELLDSSDMNFLGIVKVHKTPYLLFKQADGIKAVKYANGMYDSFTLDLKEGENLNEAGLANLKTIEDYEDLDEFHDALEDDKNTVVSSLHDIKPRLNLSGSVSYINSIIPLVNDALNQYNSTVAESETETKPLLKESYDLWNVGLDAISSVKNLKAKIEAKEVKNLAEVARILGMIADEIENNMNMAE